MAYLGLFVSAFLAATVLPMSSEVVLAALVASEGRMVLAVLVASVGNVLGSVTTLWIGRRAGQIAERNPKAAQRLERARQWLQRWGPLALIGAWLPILGDALVVAAGALRLPMLPCIAWIAIGKVGRYLAIGWAALSIVNP